MIFRLLLILVLMGFVEYANAASATLTWNANTESDLAGYKVYRGNGSCSVGPLAPLTVNGIQVTVASPATTYVDNTVPVFDGDLCYEITAFDTSGNESARSNRATKTVNLVPPTAPTGLSIGAIVP
jgi:endoglucanase